MENKRNRLLTYWANFWLTVHVAFAAYISSTYLATFVGEERVGLIYSFGSALTIIAFFLVLPIFRRFGNLRPARILAFTGFLSTILLAFASSAAEAAIFFIIYYLVSLVLRLNLDIYLESFSENKETGGIRGVFLTFANIAWLISPALAGVVLGADRYYLIYLISAVAILPLIYFLAFRLKEREVKDGVKLATFAETIRKMFNPPSDRYRYLRRILTVDLILNFFYAMMVIYTPIYLHNHIGLPWTDIGVIFTIMLLPFLLLEYPLGRLADKYWGEKELLVAGLVVAGGATASIAFITVPTIWIWALVLFATRVGAASIEIMKETYLFKKIDDRGDTIVSLTRSTIPLSYIIAPATASLFLLYFPYQYIFLALAGVVLLGLIPALRIKDTK
ncbi:MAG: hypothetical protein COV09_00530 [Candidatus Vogelbacteria bacterium CG10_big_fil_rev_8_21_14_0_10_50_13]|uniref:Major facilitator superfamily (MFS) profile domain-containing protein n=1 Tax=Candidatus Vogelbacteria bacterium CG10_big_fil_rev_8_21_14_0_10_50_13 TaxID=1975044 RepID=A0A2H0RGH6_9BACT|nr:MAG: hypothetical protein COV09_00530 [Candidatus Vogelbacteria bacterium CG10_big_fil_rev_8_21_14_0_10_50_13]